MKKLFNSKNLIFVMELAVVALSFTVAYLDNKEAVDASILKLKNALDKKSP